MTIKLDGELVSGLPSRAAEALLIYLACHPHPLPRETLAELLWADRSQKQALTNLRTILAGLKRELGDFLTITRQLIGFNHQTDYWLDSAALEAHLKGLEPGLKPDTSPTADEIALLQTALDLYQGDFLAGFFLREGRGFEEWAALQRERLRRLAHDGFRQLVRTHLEQGEYLPGIRYADRLLVLDPYDERTHRQMMLLQARAGNRNAALKHYQVCRERLMEDLGVEPSAATRELFEHLAATPFPPPHNLPQIATPFIGREPEIEAILRRLSSPHGRLVSILGPGGVGKTRLAIEAALRIVQNRPGQFLDGVTYVPLAGLTSSTYLTITLGEILNIRFEGEEPTLDQLIHVLNKREMLLVLDNFEHLVGPDSLSWLDRLLKSAPAIKILLTSRERLRLSEEQVLDLGGLSYPPTGTDEEIASNYDSIRLFFRQVERIHKGYSPKPEDLIAIIQLCQLVDGMPLGIELAAAAVRYFSPVDILDQLREKANLEFSQAPDRPARHQNLQAVFEHSWSLLTEEEQRIARRFAVFQGSFTADAAKAITDSSLTQLALLLDKSFLRRDEKADGFDLHPLMQHYLAVKLSSDPDDENSMRAKHADYYASIIVVPGDPASNMEQHFYQLKRIVDHNQGNIFHAALWFAEQHDFSDRKLVTLIERLNFFFNNTQRFEYLKVIYQQLIDSLHINPDGSFEERWLTAVLEARIAYANIILHARRRAQGQLTTLTRQAYKLKNFPLISYCHSLQGMIAWHDGDFKSASTELEKSVDTVKEFQAQYLWPALRVQGDIAFAAGRLAFSKTIHDHAFSLAVSMDSFDEAAPQYKLSEGRVRHRWGDLRAARRILAEGLSLSRPKGIPVELVSISLHLAGVMIDLGDDQEAKDLLGEAQEISDTLKDSRHHALIQRSLGWLAECKGDLEKARHYLQESLELLEVINDQSEIPFSRVALGRVLANIKEETAAREYLNAALKAFKHWNHNGGIALAQLGFGINFEHTGQSDAAENAYLAGLAAANKGQEYYFGTQIAVQLAQLWSNLGGQPQALAVLASVQGSQAIIARDKIRAGVLAEALTIELDPDDIAAAQAWGKNNTLAEALARIAEGRDHI